MLIWIAGVISFICFVNSISKLASWESVENELFAQEQLRQQNDQFMQDSMKFGMDSVTPMDHGGMNMDFGNSFNDFGSGGLFDCGGGFFDGGFFDGGFGGFGF